MTFQKGQTVYHTVKRQRAKVVRFVKSRGVYTLEWLEGPMQGAWYDANPILIEAAS